MSDYAPIPIKNGVVCLYGYGIKVYVRDNHLQLEDGICDERREGYFHKATCGIKRVVIFSRDGYITLSAIQWLYDIGAALIVFGNDNEVLIADSPTLTDIPKIRRSQSLALHNDTSLYIMKQLITEKVRGQINVLKHIECKSEMLQNRLSLITTCETFDDLMSIEATAAYSYWQQVSSFPVQFVRKDAKIVPHHWLTFGTRQSPIMRDARKAYTPANSVLNYAYGVLKSEARIATITRGLDPGIGFIHTDSLPNGFVYDVMEAIRPIVDLWLMNFLKGNLLRRDDFSETIKGEVRLSYSFRAQISAIAPYLAEAIAPCMDFIVKALAGDSNIALSLTRKVEQEQKSRKIRVRTEQLCLDCGEAVLGNRQYCDNCLLEHQVQSGNNLAHEARQRLSKMRIDGLDRAHGGEAAKKRGEKNTRHFISNKFFDVETVNIDYQREIMPFLHLLSVRRIAGATELSISYCSFIRRGIHIPHKRHWKALFDLVSDKKRDKMQDR
jgi:CRISPR-associated endonuclease Cas1